MELLSVILLSEHHITEMVLLCSLSIVLGVLNDVTFTEEKQRHIN